MPWYVVKTLTSVVESCSDFTCRRHVETQQMLMRSVLESVLCSPCPWYKEWTGNLAYPIIREPKFGRRHLYCEKSADSSPNASSVNNQRKLRNSVLSFVQEAQILVDELTGKNSRPFFCNRQNWICWYLVVSITWRPDVWCLFIALLQSRA